MPSVWVNLTDKERALITEKVPSLSSKMEHKKIRISSAKGKGRNLQKWVCAQIAEIFRIDYNQGDDHCLVHSREMGQRGTDIVLRDWLFVDFPYSIECKSSEQLNIVETIKQAESNQYAGTEWLIVHKRKALSDPIVIMRWEAFRALWEKK